MPRRLASEVTASIRSGLGGRPLVFTPFPAAGCGRRRAHHATGQPQVGRFRYGTCHGHLRLGDRELRYARQRRRCSSSDSWPRSRGGTTLGATPCPSAGRRGTPRAAPRAAGGGRHRASCERRSAPGRHGPRPGRPARVVVLPVALGEADERLEGGRVRLRVVDLDGGRDRDRVGGLRSIAGAGASVRGVGAGAVRRCRSHDGRCSGAGAGAAGRERVASTARGAGRGLRGGRHTASGSGRAAASRLLGGAALASRASA